MTEFSNAWLINQARKLYPGYDFYIPMMDNGRYVVIANEWDSTVGDCTLGNVGYKIDAMEIFNWAIKKPSELHV